MTDSFYKKSAGILATVLIGIIILSFMFTGFQTGMGPKTQDTIAQVNGTPIKASEYQRAYEQRLEMYRQMLGGNSLTSQQIAEFKIQDQVLQQLVEQKLLLAYSEKIGLFPAPQEIGKLIQNQSYFQENGQFNLNRYKDILARNRMTPADYEKLMEEELRLNELVQVISYVPVSQNYLKERISLKEKAPTVHAIRIPKNIFPSLIDVSKEKIEQFLKNSENQKKLETYFAAKKPSLDKPESVKIRHILLKVTEDRDKEKTKAEALALLKTLTPQNFAQIAKEKSDDPSSKEKGGELPLIQKGTFMPEIEDVAFSTPVGSISKPFTTRFGSHIILVESKQEAKAATLNEYKDALVKEIIQREDIEGQKKIEAETIAHFKNIISNPKENNSSLEEALKKDQARFKIQYEVGQSLGLLDDKIGEISLSATDLSSILGSTSPTGKDFVFNNAAEIIIVYAKEKQGSVEVSKEKESKEMLKEKSEQMNLLSQYSRTNTIKSLKDKAKVKLFAKLN